MRGLRGGSMRRFGWRRRWRIGRGSWRRRGRAVRGEVGLVDERNRAGSSQQKGGLPHDRRGELGGHDDFPGGLYDLVLTALLVFRVRCLRLGIFDFVCIHVRNVVQKGQ